MSAEGVLLNRDDDIRYVTVADGTAITKGTLIVLSSDPNTGIAHSGINQVPLGILVEDKVASDGQTLVGIRVRGDYDMVADGAIVLGELLEPGAAVNDVITLRTTISSGSLRLVLGRCLETASDNEVVRVRLLLG